MVAHGTDNMIPKRLVGQRSLATVGWREWVTLPTLGVAAIEVKIDSGARTSALHACDISIREVDGRTFASFLVRSSGKRDAVDYQCHAEVLEFRRVRSSNGIQEVRPVITTIIALLGQTWPIELTLTNRDEMGFRMLLGRQAVRNRFLIDTGRSYYSGTRREHVRRLNKNDQ